MSKGNPIVNFRCNPLLLHEIRLAIERANRNRMEEPYTLTNWLHGAISDKLKHLSRGRRKCQTPDERTPG